MKQLIYMIDDNMNNVNGNLTSNKQTQYIFSKVIISKKGNQQTGFVIYLYYKRQSHDAIVISSLR